MSSTLTYTSFAVAGGTGGLGALFTSELLAQGASVVVLSRTDATTPAGATVRKVDYADEASIVSALSGVQVVISALSAGGFQFQHALADASKKAGVKLFVPSEFGTVTETLPADSLLGFKSALVSHLRSIGLDYTIYYTGLFSDYVFIPPMGFDFANKKVAIFGTGKPPISFTTRPDIAKFVAYTLTHVPATKLANGTLRVEGEKITIIDLIPVLEEVLGKFTTEHVEIADAEKKVKEQGAAAFLDYIRICGEQGLLDIGKNDNDLVPNWTPLTVKEALKKFWV